MEGKKSLKVVVVGEAGSGKTALVNRLESLSHSAHSFSLPESEEAEGYYWGTNFVGSKALISSNLNGLNADFDIQEVIGSRGRMGNTMTMRAELTKADVAIYCVPMANTKSWMLRGVTRIIRMAETVNPSLRLVIVGTMEDQSTWGQANFDGTPKDFDGTPLKDFPFLPTSSLTGKGFELLLPLLWQETVNGESLMEVLKRRRAREQELKRKREEEEKEEGEKKRQEEKRKVEEGKSEMKILATNQQEGGNEITPVAPVA